MPARTYTNSAEAAWIFSDLLNSVFRRGWFSAAPSADDGKSLPYLSFHVHPDDADRPYESLENAMIAYGGNTKWRLKRTRQNRLILCPEQVALRAEQLGNFGNAVMEIRETLPHLERGAATDLILLSDFLYDVTLGRR